MFGTVAGGFMIHGVFGSYTLWAQYHGIIDAVSILKTQGAPAAMMAVIDTLPFSKVVMLIYCAFSTIFLATTVNSGCYVVAATATRRMPVDADPHRYHCTFWAVAQGLLALGLLAMGGLEVAKIFGNFSGALMALPSPPPHGLLVEDHPRGRQGPAAYLPGQGLTPGSEPAPVETAPMLPGMGEGFRPPEHRFAGAERHVPHTSKNRHPTPSRRMSFIDAELGFTPDYGGLCPPFCGLAAPFQNT